MKKIDGRKIFVLIFSVICVAVCVFVAQLVSSVITVSGGASITETATGKFSGFDVYAISLGSYTSELQAESNTSNVLKKNGAGYVYKADGLYHVIASAYLIENDAKSVQGNLQEGGIQSQVVKLTFDVVDFAGVSSARQQKNFCAALICLKTVYTQLYDISVSLDTKVMDDSKARIEIIAVKSLMETALEGTSKGSSSTDGIYYQMIKNKYDEVENLLIQLKNYENTEGVELSAKIKNTYMKSLNLIEDLIDLLNNKI